MKQKFLNWFLKHVIAYVKPKYTDIMLDIETIGTRPGDSVLAIGAVGFARPPQKFAKRMWVRLVDWLKLPYPHLTKPFYVTINRSSNVFHGLNEDEETITWWTTKPEEARVIFDFAERDGTTLPLALIAFRDYFNEFPKGSKLWGCGSEFDVPILRHAYYHCSMEEPWKFFNLACYRTLKGFYPSRKIIREGIYHNALDDAKNQAVHAIWLLNKLGL